MNTNQVQPSALLGVCEHLGMKDDPRTSLAYPSVWNHCYLANPPETVRLEHQRAYCLSAAHVQCPVFQANKAAPLPQAIRGRHPPEPHRNRAGVIIPILLGLLALAAGLAWFAEAKGMLQIPGLPLPRAASTGAPSAVPATASPMPTLRVVVPPVVSTSTPQPTPADPAVEPTYFDSSAPTPTPITTSAAWCGHQMDVPFGPGNKLLIHKVGGGDSLNGYEITYRTSVKAIEGVNLTFRIPVPRETVLVIPLDTLEVGGLPVLEPMQVSERNTPIQTMAYKLSADLLAFEKYNGFDESCRDFIGWVVAPRARPAP
jgi:hypothetical protein